MTGLNGLNGIILGQKSISNKANAYKRPSNDQLNISQPYKKLCLQSKMKDK